MPIGTPGLVSTGPEAGLSFHKGLLPSWVLLLTSVVVLSLGHRRLDCQDGADKLVWGDVHGVGVRFGL
jgi:hypothetical protein